LPSASGKIVFLSLALLLSGFGFAKEHQSDSEVIKITSALDIPGSFSGGLSLQIDPGQGYALTNLPDREAQWSLRCFFKRRLPAERSVLIRYQGKLTLRIQRFSQPDLIVVLDSIAWKEERISLGSVPSRWGLKLIFDFDSRHKGSVGSVTFDGKLVGFDQRFQYRNVSESESESESETVTEKVFSAFPLGVNLEAEYVFLELQESERKQLLKDLMDDGFRHIRLHKLFRVHQRIGWDRLKEPLKAFLDQMDRSGLSLYLDLLSYPLADGFSQGWKQVFFLHKTLQAKLEDWIQNLKNLKIGNSPFFEWDGLKYVCLVNENSLFHESSDQALSLILREFTLAIQERGFHSLDEFKSDRMCSIYSYFQKSIRSLGFRGPFFLSNYQAGGRDLQVQMRCSPEIDRHFYLDYPHFFNSTARVHNISPVENYAEIKARFRDLIPESGGFISEINLPWPNRFQHELIPLILALARERPIHGLWFYDYRLKSSKFHAGGLFGIQRFRSIINQLPLFRRAMREGYEVQERDHSLYIQGKGFSCESGWISVNGMLLALTLWKDEKEQKTFSFEKGSGDRFDPWGNRQLEMGSLPMILDLKAPYYTP